MKPTETPQTMNTDPKEYPQHMAVLEYLHQVPEGLTSLEAVTRLGIISFPKRISTLRQMGFYIEQKSIVVKSKLGKKRVNRYFIPRAKA